MADKTTIQVPERFNSHEMYALVDVERSFAMYKNILAPDGINFSEKNFI